MNKLQNLISQLEKHHKKKLDLSLGIGLISFYDASLVVILDSEVCSLFSELT